MKIYKYCLIIFSVLAFFACEKETEGLSRSTFYCDLILKGKATELIPIGQTFTDPGYTALENETDVTDKVTVSGTVNTNAAGLYVITYTVLNSDGYAKTTTRQVVVYNATPSALETGFYKVSKASNRTGFGAGPGASGSAEFATQPSILVYQESPGKFYISDFIGGYYEVGRAYGPTYAMVGHFTLNADNTMTLVDSKIAGWGDGLGDLVNGVYDPAAKTLTYTAQYAESYDFNIIATKQ